MGKLSALEEVLVARFLAKELSRLETWILRIYTMYQNSSTTSSVCHRCVTRKIEFYSQKMNAISYLRIISYLKKKIFCLKSLEKEICIALT
jgi:hypothetical protein